VLGIPIFLPRSAVSTTKLHRQLHSPLHGGKPTRYSRGYRKRNFYRGNKNLPTSALRNQNPNRNYLLWSHQKFFQTLNDFRARPTFSAVAFIETTHIRGEDYSRIPTNFVYLERRSRSELTAGSVPSSSLLALDCSRRLEVKTVTKNQPVRRQDGALPSSALGHKKLRLSL